MDKSIDPLEKAIEALSKGQNAQASALATLAVAQGLHRIADELGNAGAESRSP